MFYYRQYNSLKENLNTESERIQGLVMLVWVPLEEKGH